MEAPTPTPTPNSEPAPEETKPARNPAIPDDQDQLAALAVFMAGAWLLNPQLVLIWITQAEFAAKAGQFDARLKARNRAGALRPQQTRSFAQYDQQIREGLDDVKGYLKEAYGKEGAKSYFAEFGIETRGDNYELPRSQKERADALEMLVDALTTHGFESRKFGTAYWQPIANGYADLTGKARKASATVSTLVGEKDELKDEMEEVLSAMLSLLDANYRDEKVRAAKRREMGYQREYH